MNPELWLTARRIRIHGLLLAVCLWTVYAVDMSAPGLLDRNGLVKGTDFLHFYTLGNLALQRPRRSFVRHAGTGRAGTRICGAGAGQFVRPALRTAGIFVFRALRPAALWLGVDRVARGEPADLCVLLLCRVEELAPAFSPYRGTVLILAIAFPGFFHLLAWGQTSGLALLCFTLAYLALRSDRRLLAGLAIGSLIFKPQLGLAAAVVFLFARQWKLIAGGVMAASIQLAAAWMHYGTEVMRNYLRALMHLEDVLPLLEPRLYQTHSLRSFWSLLLPWPRVAFALYVVTALGVLALAVRVWRSGSSLSVRFSALLFATVLVSPHLTVYDLVILAPAFLLLGDWALANRRTDGSPFGCSSFCMSAIRCF